jgi:hypothetical protein
MHVRMLTMFSTREIGPEVPAYGTSAQFRGDRSSYFLNMLRKTKKALAGRSPKRRMKYGYHSVPNGT